MSTRERPLTVIEYDSIVPQVCENGSQSPVRRSRQWVLDSNPHAEIKKAPPYGSSRRSMLTNVHCCLQVPLAARCEIVVNERGLWTGDDHDDGAEQEPLIARTSFRAVRNRQVINIKPGSVKVPGFTSHWKPLTQYHHRKGLLCLIGPTARTQY